MNLYGSVKNAISLMVAEAPGLWLSSTEKKEAYLQQVAATAIAIHQQIRWSDVEGMEKLIQSQRALLESQAAELRSLRAARTPVVPFDAARQRPTPTSTPQPGLRASTPPADDGVVTGIVLGQIMSQSGSTSTEPCPPSAPSPSSSYSAPSSCSSGSSSSYSGSSDSGGSSSDGGGGGGE